MLRNYKYFLKLKKIRKLLLIKVYDLVNSLKESKMKTIHYKLLFIISFKYYYFLLNK